MPIHESASLRTLLSDPHAFSHHCGTLNLVDDVATGHSAESIWLARILAGLNGVGAVGECYLAAAATLRRHAETLQKESGYPTFDKDERLWWRGVFYRLRDDDVRLMRMFCRNRTTPSSPDAIRAALDNYYMNDSTASKRVHRLKTELKRLGVGELAEAIRSAGRFACPGSFVMTPVSTTN